MIIQDLYLLQVARLESQVIRFKTAAETAERSEEELKTERRKMQREVFPRIIPIYTAQPSQLKIPITN